MAIKMKIGKLDLSFDLKELVSNLSKNNIEILPIALEHVNPATAVIRGR